MKSADRQRWSCRSSLTLSSVRSDRRGAPLHSLDLQLESQAALPFSASLCFCGAWKVCEKSRFPESLVKSQRKDLSKLTRFNM